MTLQLDEAKDTISRLIRDALPAAAQDGASAPTTASGINFFGGANLVQIHIASAAATAPQPTAASAIQPDPVQLDTAHPALSRRRRSILLQRIDRREQELGKPGLSLRFFKSIYNTCDVSSLAEAQLDRALRWLEENDL